MPVCWQQPWCYVNWPMAKNPKVLPVTPGSNPGVDLLSLSVSSFIIPCSSKDIGDRMLSFNPSTCAPDPLTSCPKVLKCFFIALGLLVATSMHENQVKKKKKAKSLYEVIIVEKCNICGDVLESFWCRGKIVLTTTSIISPCMIDNICRCQPFNCSHLCLHHWLAGSVGYIIIHLTYID